MLNFLPTWIVLQNSHRYLHDSDEENKVRFTKGERIFLYVILGVLIAIAVAIAITMVIIAIVAGMVFMTALF